MTCYSKKPNYIGMYYVAAKIWQAMPHDFYDYLNGVNNAEESFLSLGEFKIEEPRDK